MKDNKDKVNDKINNVGIQLMMSGGKFILSCARIDTNKPINTQ